MSGRSGPPETEELAALLAGQDAWVVGGTVRDELLGRPRVDIDLAIAGDPRRAARGIARALGVPAFELSAAFGTWRVAGDGWQVDCSALQGATIEDDLARRDLTVNAIAVPLAGGPRVDPHGGVGDLERGVLRMVAARAFADDPLRTLRVPRLACELGFSVDEATAAEVRAAAAGLATVAGERCFAELARIVCGDRAVAGLRMLDTFGLLAVVLPELHALRGVEQNRYHHLDAFEHTLLVLERATELERGLAAAVPGLGDEDAAAIGAQLSEPLGDGLTRFGAVRLAALLHDAGKPQTQARAEDGTVLGFPHHAEQGVAIAEAAMRRLRTSERLRTQVGRLTRHHLGLGFLVHADPLDDRAIYRYLRATAPVHLDVSVLSIADRLATGGHKAAVSTERHLAVAAAVLPRAVRFDAVLAAPPLVRGDALAAALGLRPGPELGALLAAIAEERYAGTVTTAEEAIAFARDRRSRAAAGD